MPGEINLGDNYQIDEDGSGNLVIKDGSGTTVLQHTDGGAWSYGANVDHGGNDVSNVGALDADSLSNVRTPIAGEVQSAINDLDSNSSIGTDSGDTRGYVFVKPGEVLDPGSTIDVKPGVCLDARHALFAPSTDYDGFFVDNGAWCYVNADVDSTYSSRIAYLDTAESRNGKYGPGVAGTASEKEAARVGVRVRNVTDPASVSSATSGGRALSLVDTNGVGIVNLPVCFVDAFGTGTGLHLKPTSGGYVNTAVTVNIDGCNHLVDHEAPGNDNAVSNLTGVLQCASGTDYGVRNRGSGESINFRGNFWDPQNADVNALAGPNIEIHDTTARTLNDWSSNNWTDNSTGTAVFGGARGVWQMYTAASDYTWTMRGLGDRLEFERDGTALIRLRSFGTGEGRIQFNDADVGWYGIRVGAGVLEAVSPSGNTSTLVSN